MKALQNLANLFQIYQQQLNSSQPQNKNQNRPQTAAPHPSFVQILREQGSNPAPPRKQPIRSSIRPISFNSTFVHNTNHGFDNYKNVFTLKKEIQKHLLSCKIRVAYIKKKEQLVIKAVSKEDHEMIQKEWPSGAFDTVIKMLIKPTKLFIALINVGQEFDVSVKV